MLTLLLYWMPYGGVIGLPLMWLSTLAHELGHGFTALLVGGRFQALELSADGSGFATTRTSGPVWEAIVAAGGLLGPAVAGAGCFAVSRSTRGARSALGLLVCVLIVVDLMWMANVFGLLYNTGLLLLLAWIATRWSPEMIRGVMVFLGTQLGLSVFQRGDYLFAAEAHTSRGSMPSDVAVIREVLWLPIPVWGTLLSVASVAMLARGLWWSLGPWGKRAA